MKGNEGKSEAREVYGELHEVLVRKGFIKYNEWYVFSCFVLFMMSHEKGNLEQGETRA